MESGAGQVIIESTNASTVKVPHQAKWVSLREDRETTADGLVWIFTDGSSLGGYGAVVIVDGTVTKFRGHQKPTSTRNVGAELNGMILGLEHAPKGSQVAIVSDYLGVAAWLSNNWRIKDEEVRAKIRRARKIARERTLTFARLIHHKGHQKDDSAFTRWNHLADRLAAGEVEPGRLDSVE